MSSHRLFVIAASSMVVLAGLGCASHNYAYAPTPPPPAYVEAPQLVQVAERNGFQTGQSDGARDAYDGRHYRAQSTRAYNDAPGYDQGLGPFGPYRNAFRNAYLRGYDKGFRRG